MTDDTHTTTASSTAEDLARSARAAARDAADAAKAHLADAYDRARTTASDTGETVASVVMDLMDRRMTDTAQGFRDMSQALYRAADESGDRRFVRQIVELAADSFDSIAGTMEQRTTREVMDDLTRFGRTNPASFMMGSLLAGFALGRLLTADGDDGEDEDATATRDDTPQDNSDAFGTSQAGDV